MKNFSELFDDVRAGRRVVRDFLRNDAGSGETIVAFEDGDEIVVSNSEARELSAARRGGRGSDNLDWLAEALG